MCLRTNARRFAAEGTERDFAVCAQLLKASPDAAATEILLTGIELGVVGRRFDKVPEPLAGWFAETWSQKEHSPKLLRLGLRLSDAGARKAALEIIEDAKSPEANRAELIAILGQTADDECVPKLLALFQASPSSKLGGTALSALQNFSDPSVAATLIESYASLGNDLRSRIRSALGSRLAWSRLLVEAAEHGRIAAKDFSVDSAPRP